jgi:hypothetical protein
MRPSLRAAWQAKAKQRRQMLEAVATRSGRAPFMIVGNIDWERVGAYLMGEAV